MCILPYSNCRTVAAVAAQQHMRTTVNTALPSRALQYQWCQALFLINACTLFHKQPRSNPPYHC
jgi:hypothetical protein